MASNAGGTVDSAVSTFRKLRELAKEGKLPAEGQMNMLDRAGHLAEAQVQLATLHSKLEEFQRHQAALDEIQRWKRNYALSETPMGARVYRLKDDANTGEPPHEICPACFDRDERSILQPRGSLLQCDRCSTNYQVAEAGALYAPSRPNRFPGFRSRRHHRFPFRRQTRVMRPAWMRSADRTRSCRSRRRSRSQAAKRVTPAPAASTAVVAGVGTSS